MNCCLVHCSMAVWGNRSRPKLKLLEPTSQHSRSYWNTFTLASCPCRVWRFVLLIFYCRGFLLSLSCYKIVLVLQEDIILDILGLAHQYGFENLEKSICEYFIKSLSTQNVFSIYDAARLYQLKSLTEHCMGFIDRNLPPIILTSSKEFLQLSPVSESSVKSTSGIADIASYQLNSNFCLLCTFRLVFLSLRSWCILHGKFWLHLDFRKAWKKLSSEIRSTLLRWRFSKSSWPGLPPTIWRLQRIWIAFCRLCALSWWALRILLVL